MSAPEYGKPLRPLDLFGCPVITNPNVPQDQVLIMSGDMLRSLGGGIPPKDYSLRARVRRAWNELTERAVTA
jgi:hypothetical protein